MGEYGFDFRRFGVRVPTVLVSPLIAAGTVFRVPDGSMPLDHTSIPRTVEARWGLRALTARDAAAPEVSDALTLATARTDDPLAGVVVPSSVAPNPAEGVPSHLQQVQAELVSQLPLAPAQRIATTPCRLPVARVGRGCRAFRTPRWVAEAAERATYAFWRSDPRSASRSSCP